MGIDIRRAVRAVFFLGGGGGMRYKGLTCYVRFGEKVKGVPVTVAYDSIYRSVRNYRVCLLLELLIMLTMVLVFTGNSVVVADAC